MVDRHRYRVWFSKTDVLRWISHRDLLRLWERLLRRQEIGLSMTEGFHPKPRMHFPSALALGVPGRREVLEIDVTRWYEPSQLKATLEADRQPGLAVLLVEHVPLGLPKAQLASASYRMTLPPEILAQVLPWLSETRWRDALIDRPPASSIDESEAEPAPIPDRTAVLGDHVSYLECSHGELRFGLRAVGGKTLKPEVVAAALGISAEHWPSIAGTLCREAIEVEPPLT